MDTVFTGRIWKLPDDVDTDTIIPGRYGVLPSAEEMSRHCLEPLRPELAAAARPGDIFGGREELWLRFLAGICTSLHRGAGCAMHCGQILCPHFLLQRHQ